MAFDGIYGHERPLRILQQAMAGDRMAHAYLFYGMEGIGKKTTALFFSKALNCRDGRGRACGRCPSCLKTDHGNHADLKIIKPAGQTIRIQEVREIQQQMAFRPLEGGWRTFILVEAERMNIAAANALLKTLEEPTPANIIILISSRPYLLPVTVLSRCQPLRFNPLARETVERYLREHLSLAEEHARLLAASSGGSIGKALEMNDEGYLSLRDEMLEQMMTIQGQSPFRLFSMSQALGQDRREILMRLDILRGCFRDALVFRETGMIHALCNQDRAPDIGFFARSHETPDLLRYIGIVDWAYAAIEQNANKPLTLETMVFRLAATSS